VTDSGGWRPACPGQGYRHGTWRCNLEFEPRLRNLAFVLLTQPVCDGMPVQSYPELQAWHPEGFDQAVLHKLLGEP